MKHRRRRDSNTLLVAFAALVLTALLSVLVNPFKHPLIESGLNSANPLQVAGYFESMLVVDPSFAGAESVDFASDLSTNTRVCTHPLKPPKLPIVLPTHYPAILQEYVKFHEHGRKCLDALANNVRLPKVPDAEFCRRPKLLLYFNQGRQSGLGDTGRGMTLALLFAIATRRLFFIPGLAESTSYFPLTSAFVPSSFDWRVSPSVLKYCGQQRENHSTFVRLIRRQDRVFSFKTASTELFHDASVGSVDRDDHAPFHKLFEPFDVVHLFPRISRGALYAVARMLSTQRGNDAYSELLGVKNLDVMLTHMLFRPSVIVDHLASKLVFPHHDAEPYASVHIRTGHDTKEEVARRFGEAGLFSEQIATDALRCVRDVTEYRNVFLASDSMSVKESMKKMAPKYRMQVSTCLEQAMHTSTLLRQTEDNESNEMARVKECRGFLNAVVDIVALSKSSVLVAAPSTFADFAFQLGNMSDFAIVDIRNVGSKKLATCQNNQLDPSER